MLALSTLPLNKRIEQKVADIIGQRTADEKLHGKVVNTLGILLLVSCLCQHLALREEVAYRTGERLKALERTRHLRIDHSVEKQMPFVKCVFGPDKRNRTTPVLAKEL